LRLARKKAEELKQQLARKRAEEEIQKFQLFLVRKRAKEEAHKKAKEEAVALAVEKALEEVAPLAEEIRALNEFSVLFDDMMHVTQFYYKKAEYKLVAPAYKKKMAEAYAIQNALERRAARAMRMAATHLDMKSE